MVCRHSWYLGGQPLRGGGGAQQMLSDQESTIDRDEMKMHRSRSIVKVGVDILLVEYLHSLLSEATQFNVTILEGGEFV